MTRRARGLIGLSAAALAALAAARYWPLPGDLIDRAAQPSTIVLDRHGAMLYEARNDAGLRGDPVDAARLPPLVAAATLAAEDHRFYWHPGIDPVAVARATWSTVARGRTEGGSTLSQQTARLLLDRRSSARRDRNLTAKVREASLAWRLEGRRSKREILALYLTLAPYGNQIAGIRRAARNYFGVEPERLTPAQAAYLAALPQQPSRFNPRTDASRARARQQWILRRMAEAGAITGPDLEAALAERLALAPRQAPFAAPHFVQMLLAGRREPAARIVTTIDLGLQRDVEGIVTAHRPQLTEIGARHAAVVVLDNRTGEWLAWEGSGDYGNTDGGAINGPTSLRQPGSTLKPFTYALAFEHGYDPGSVLADVPSEFPTADPAVSYRPENYDGRFRGPMRARAALAGSENVPAVALAADLGVPRLQRMLTRLGFTSFDRASSHYGLGMTLGNAEVRLDELVAAYAALARGGIARPTSGVIEVDGVRRETRDAGQEATRVMSYRSAWWVTDILADPDARAFIFGRGGLLEFPFPAAVKTGTSQAFHDNWIVGYTRDVTVGVWVGNFDRTPLARSSGVSGAGPIFHAVMLAAADRTAGVEGDILPAPEDVARRAVCLDSGALAGNACPRQGMEWTRPGPRGRCGWHRHERGRVVTEWPAEYARWAASEGLLDEGPAGPASPGLSRATVATSSGALRIVVPSADAVYLIDPTLRPAFQTLALAAEGARGRVSWTIDGRPIGGSGATATVDWPLTPGRHTAEATDAAGRTHRVSFLVK